MATALIQLSRITKVKLKFVSILSILFFSQFNFQNSSKSSVSPEKLKEALKFCRVQKLDTVYASFVDMQIPSGKNRFFITDLHSGKIICKSLCCHGMGGNSTESKAEFSNEPGSYCTSLGKYRTGIRAYSQWGIHVHYKLHGLEKTNSNAFKRIVVLHSYDLVSEDEIYPNYLRMGWSLGCPVVSNNCMKFVDSLLKKQKRDQLLWIF